VLTEIPWNENPDSHSNAASARRPPPRASPGAACWPRPRRGSASSPSARRADADAAGAARPAGARQPSRGPLGLRSTGRRGSPGGRRGRRPADWQLEVTGPQPYALSLAEVEALPAVEVELPFAANEGWGADVRWRGPRLLDLVPRAGGTASSQVRVFSLEPRDPSTSRWSRGTSWSGPCWPPTSTASG
jgi:hypothetical protein